MIIVTCLCIVKYITGTTSFQDCNNGFLHSKYNKSNKGRLKIILFNKVVLFAFVINIIYNFCYKIKIDFHLQETEDDLEILKITGDKKKSQPLLNYVIFI